MTQENPFAITPDVGSSLANRTGSWRTLRPVYVNRLPPCNAKCPAGEKCRDWLFLAQSGDYEGAWKEIVEDNPFPAVMGRVCYHTCQTACNRGDLDEPVGINAVERFLGDHALRLGWKLPQPAEANGKRILVVGAGPAGLSAAYHLRRMGYAVHVVESAETAGGMMRYGIPDYRLPRTLLDSEIASILSLGIEVHTEVDIGTDVTFDELKRNYDSLYLSIGAHTDKKTGIDGENSHGVISAVELLRNIGDGIKPDFTGLNIAVIGGGNVAMDVTRSCIRLGARKVSCVYRRRQEDMTAQQEEVEGAIAEGAEILTLEAPVRIEADEKGNVAALWTQPQIIGEIDAQGRPKPHTAQVPEKRIPADVIIEAIGQGIETHGFEEAGIHIQRRGTLLADSSTQVPDLEGVFAGGDCVTGPATVIRAIAAGKAAAANIDDYLGFRHEIHSGVSIPAPKFYDLNPRGRVNTTMRDAFDRKNDFACMECGLSREEADQEASRCLRCDHFGYGIFKGGRVDKW